MVVAGADLNLYHKCYCGGWSGWDSLGMYVSGSHSAIASWGSGRLDVFAIRYSDLALVHRAYRSGGWSAREVLTVNSLCANTPAAVSWDVNRIEVFSGCDGIGNGLRHHWWNGTQWGWEYLYGGTIDTEAGPAVSSWAPGRLDVFGVGTTGYLYHKCYCGGWSGWDSLGKPDSNPISGPGAVSWGSNRIDVFVSTGTLWQRAWR